MSILKRMSVIVCVFALSLSVFACKRENETEIHQNMINNNDYDTDFELTLVSASFDYENAFTSRDISAKYDDNVYSINLSDNNTTSDNQEVNINKNTVTITSAGTYIISGTLSDGQIIVEADAADKIQLVLNDVDINSNSTSAIKVLEAKKVFITLSENSKNTLSSLNEFVQTDEDKADGVVYSKRGLTLNGSGQLSIKSAYGHGIVCNDDLVITDGVYNIQSENHALKGRDSIYFADGTLNINSNNDAVHCSHDTNSEKGNIYIKNANLEIAAADDAIHASGFILIDDGSINISECNEGIEAQKIEINGGNISLVSDDDGINASSAQSTDDSENQAETTDDFIRGNKLNSFDSDEDCYIYINGGNIVVDADGDGLDSNGYLQQSGGNVIVYGPENDGNAAIDYSLSAKITGGTIVAFCSGGMAQGFASCSTQASMLIRFDSSSTEKFILSDKKNNEIISCETSKLYNCVTVSSPDITTGEAYIAAAGNQSKSIELNEICFQDESVKQAGGMFKGRQMENGDEAPRSDMKEMPDRGAGGMKGEPHMSNDNN